MLYSRYFFLKFFTYPIFFAFSSAKKKRQKSDFVNQSDDVQHYNNWNFIYSCYTKTFETSA